MQPLSDKNRANVIKTFTDSRHLDDLLNIDNQYFLTNDKS